MILLKLHLVSLLCYCPFFILLHTYAGLHEDSQRMFELEDTLWRPVAVVILVVMARGPSRCDASTDVNLPRRVLRADWINWINRMNHQWNNFVSEKFIYIQKSSSLHWVKKFLFLKFSLIYRLKIWTLKFCATHSFFKYNGSQYIKIENVR